MYLLRHFHYVIDIITWQTKVYLFRIYLLEDKKTWRIGETLWLFWEYLWFSLTKNEDDTKLLLTAIT